MKVMMQTEAGDELVLDDDATHLALSVRSVRGWPIVDDEQAQRRADARREAAIGAILDAISPISAGGTKGELAKRLYDAGLRAGAMAELTEPEARQFAQLVISADNRMPREDDLL